MMMMMIIIILLGEVMGPVISAILDGNTFQPLIRLPLGCAEQSISRLGPLVYVAKYLKETGQTTAEKETQVYDYIREGVQHSMQYRKPGNNFGFWPSQTYQGSTSLTAFSTKIFLLAEEFNAMGTVPSNVICSGVEWMAQQQKPSGAFQEPSSIGRRLMVRKWRPE